MSKLIIERALAGNSNFGNNLAQALDQITSSNLTIDQLEKHFQLILDFQAAKLLAKQECNNLIYSMMCILIDREIVAFHLDQFDPKIYRLFSRVKFLCDLEFKEPIADTEQKIIVTNQTSISVDAIPYPKQQRQLFYNQPQMKRFYEKTASQPSDCKFIVKLESRKNHCEKPIQTS